MWVCRSVGQTRWITLAAPQLAWQSSVIFAVAMSNLGQRFGSLWFRLPPRQLFKQSPSSASKARDYIVRNLQLQARRRVCCKRRTPNCSACTGRCALQALRASKRAGPGPLKVVAAEPTGHIDHFADEIQPGDALAAHGLRLQFAGIDAASGDFCLGVAQGARGCERPCLQAAAKGREICVAAFGQGALRRQSAQFQPCFGQTARQDLGQGVAELAARGVLERDQ